jgi:hypothetical protein
MGRGMSSNLQRLGGDAVVTKRKPGAVIGRPRKQIVPKVKRPSRGQPRKALTAWPNLYEYAFAEGLMKYQAETKGISRAQTAVVVAKLFVSEIVPTTANIMAALRGDDFYIRPRPGCDREGNKNSKEWRDKDVWNKWASDILRAICAINEQPISDDAIWLDTMSALWRMAFSGASETKYFRWAKSVARYAGELQYWRRRIKPVMMLSARLEGQPLNIAQAILAGSLRIEGPRAGEAIPAPNWSPNSTDFLPRD